MEPLFWQFVIVGFVAQMIDGALGMAYGVSSNAFLLSLGLPPAVASASVHLAEVFTTAVSGASHWRMGNIDRALVKRLMIPGVIGGMTGAYILSSIDGDVIKPWLSAYLAAMGVYILWKALRGQVKEGVVTPPRHISLLGLFGGFVDAIGGGGWGPVVTTTLVARGNSPRKTVGSVNLSEFAVTLAQSVVFFLTLGTVHWQVVAGLLLGGIIAAPSGAYLVRRVPARALMSFIGVLIIGLSVRTIVLAIR
jgi:uncharacterized membrane protein YfcA